MAHPNTPSPSTPSSTCIHVKPPAHSSLPPEALPGDILTGELLLLKDEDKKNLVGKYSLTCHVGPAPLPPAKKPSNGSKSLAKPTAAERLRDFKIEVLADIAE